MKHLEALLAQFQGMKAAYEKEQADEKEGSPEYYRAGQKAHSWKMACEMTEARIRIATSEIEIFGAVQ